MDAGTISIVMISCLIVALVIAFALISTYLYWYKPRRTARQRLAQRRTMDADRERWESHLQQRQLIRQQLQQQELEQQHQRPQRPQQHQPPPQKQQPIGAPR
ncbi:hypothetical protein PG985_008227 [Apiospora marii]|uniref:Uncharacterized protein n=1 Tax=Apiospora marii TaxID=335849 RepID=A0ABR1R9W9_9PEZI